MSSAARAAFDNLYHFGNKGKAQALFIAVTLDMQTRSLQHEDTHYACVVDECYSLTAHIAKAMKLLDKAKKRETGVNEVNNPSGYLARSCENAFLGLKREQGSN